MRKILIVDDDKNNRLAIKLNVIKHPDIAILEAKDGKEAVEICESEKVDIIFMDIMMPVMDGIEATTIIKKNHPSIMVVAISAMDDDMHKSLMLKAGAEDYITKPFHPDVLKKRLVNYLRLIVSRSSQDIHLSRINLFKEPVYDRRVSFKILRETSLALFWEEYLLSERYGNMTLLCDAGRSIYDVGLELLASGHHFNIHCEENEKSLLFTLESNRIIDLPKVNAILEREFVQGEYRLADNFLSCRTRIQETIGEIKTSQTVDNATPALKVGSGSSQVYRKISAQEYLKGFEDDLFDRREEFEKAYEKLDSLIFNISKNNNYELLHSIGSVTSELAQQIERLFEFHLLAQAVVSLGESFEALDLESLDDHMKTLIIGFLNGFLTDFDCWIREIFIDMSADDIHYLDDSLISSFSQITSLIQTQKKGESEEMEMLFF